MTTVKCPACKERVSGESKSELSENVREHFVERHGLSRTEEMEGQREMRSEVESERGSRMTRGGGVGKGVVEGEQESAYTVGDTRTMAGMGKEGAIERVAPSGSEEARGINVEGRGDQRREASVSGGEMTEEEVECPICCETICAECEEDLSEGLEQHIAHEHEKEPFVTQMMEERRGRR